MLWDYVPKDEIASSLGMNDVTLRKHFSNIGKKFRAVGKRIS
jgi:hypothetical protein